MLKRLIVLLMVVLLSALVAGQGTLAPSPKFTGFDTNGNPVTGGKLCTYVAGTTTPIATYTDVGLTTPNANPIILDAAGRATIFLTQGTSYKFLLLTPGSDGTCATGTTVWTQDNITTVPTSSASTDVVGTFGATATAGQCVYMNDGSGGLIAGQWYLCNTANTYSSTTPAVGIATAGVTAGTTGIIRMAGLVTGLSALATGSTYYVTSVSGSLTAVAPPTNYRVVGQAQSTTTMVVGAGPSASASASNLLAGTLVVSRLGNGTFTLAATSATGTQNNFNPGISGNTLVLVASAAPITITGFPAGVAGQQILVLNTSTQVVTFKYNDAGSSVGNRLLQFTQSDLKLGTSATINGSALFAYDTGNARWVMTDFAQGDPLPWTPTLTFGGAAVGMTYTTQTGVYQVIGKMVFFSGRITLSAKGASVGAAGIAGLPMTLSTATGAFGSVVFSFTAGTTGTQGGIQGMANTGGSAGIQLLSDAGAGTGSATVSDANFNNNTDLIFTGSWPAN